MLNKTTFEYIYSSGEVEPLEFYVNALVRSSRLDLGLGFFSSSGFRALSIGFAPFIHNGGKMRIVINSVLSEEDKDAIQTGLASSPDEILIENIIKKLVDLEASLNRYDAHFFKCFAYLISKNRVEIKIVRPIHNGPGIVHQKFGLFYDNHDNTIAFNGSCNFSANALLNNVELIDCFPSWSGERGDLKRIDLYKSKFESIWDDSNPGTKQISVDNVKTYIKSNYPSPDLFEIDQEFSDITSNPPIASYLSKELQRELRRIKENDLTELNPQVPSYIDIRGYQQKAVENWIEKDFQGLFEMATGTGKTITAILAILKLIEAKDRTIIIVLAPTISLVNQWVSELKSFNFRNIIKASSKNKSWDNHLISGLTSFDLGTITNLIVVSTYDSFKSSRFQNIVTKIPEESLIIADECHYLGAAEMKAKLPWGLKYRLGLSATPHRHYDEAGTSILLQYLNAEKKPTYALGLGKAISKGFLCEYELEPHFVELTKSEYSKYVELSNKIAKKLVINASGDGSFNFSEMDSYTERLLIERKRLVNQAENKLQVVGQIINKLDNDSKNIHHTLVYCAEGSRDDIPEIDRYGRFLAFEHGLRINKFTGETPADKRETLLKQFDEGEIQCLLAMKCLDEGIDVKRTETAIFVASSTNPRQYIQRRGRVLRTHPSKPFAYLHDLIVLPPIELLEDDLVSNIEKGLLIQELKRFTEFASEAVNYSDCHKIIESICDKYGVEL